MLLIMTSLLIEFSSSNRSAVCSLQMQYTNWEQRFMTFYVNKPITFKNIIVPQQNLKLDKIVVLQTSQEMLSYVLFG